MTVAVIKYNAGNVFSVTTALRRIGANFLVTDEIESIRSAERVIFPGVGEASSSMHYLKERGLADVISNLSQPMLGICLGLQLMCASSAENDTECLGIVRTPILRFTKPRKIPHIGWSKVQHTGHALFEGIPSGSYFYFVHSFRANLSEETIAQCSYEEDFSAAIGKGNFAGVQFHPEKSSDAGQKLLTNFLRWNP